MEGKGSGRHAPSALHGWHRLGLALPLQGRGKLNATRYALHTHLRAPQAAACMDVWLPAHDSAPLSGAERGRGKFRGGLRGEGHGRAPDKTVPRGRLIA